MISISRDIVYPSSMTEEDALRLLSGDACRAARALLRWSVRDLVRQAGTSPNVINRVEAGGTVRGSTALKIASTFEAAGVELLNSDAPGARLRPGGS